MDETIQLDIRESVATVTLNRPEVRNAFNARMIEELTEVFRDLADHEQVRVIVLEGSGHSFSAGADVQWMRASLEYGEEENLEDALRMSRMFQTINTVPKPVIARVHGAALGGGIGLAAVADVVVAAEDTVFGFTEVKLGIIPAVISRFVLPKIGESWARALFTTGERFGTEDARRIGLVHWIVSLDNLNAAVAEKAREILASGPEAVQEAKRLIDRARTLDDREMTEFTARRIATLRTGVEGQEGLKAFLEKRFPSWRREA